MVLSHFSSSTKKTDFDDTHDHSSDSYRIVEKTTKQSFGYYARSFQGFDKNGIVLFEHHFFCGTAKDYIDSQSSIASAFPASDAGASSMIVSKGVWSLHTKEHYGGTKINIGGVDEFGPGTRLESFGAAEDKVKSVQYLRDN